MKKNSLQTTKDIFDAISNKIANQKNKEIFHMIKKEVLVKDCFLLSSFSYGKKYHKPDCLVTTGYIDCLEQQFPKNIATLNIPFGRFKGLNVFPYALPGSVIHSYDANETFLMPVKFSIKFVTFPTFSALHAPKRGTYTIVPVPKETGFVQPKDVNEKICIDEFEYDLYNLSIKISVAIDCVDENFKNYKIIKT